MDKEWKKRQNKKMKHSEICAKMNDFCKNHCENKQGSMCCSDYCPLYSFLNGDYLDKEIKQ